MSVEIPASHLDLLVRPIHAVLSTIMPDGQPQLSIVWADYESGNVLINTTLERQKSRNMQRNPKVNVLLVDPQDGSRYLEVRGLVTGITQEGAVMHADKLTQAYSNGEKRHFYGDIYPLERQAEERRVIVKIAPVKITTDAVFS